MAETFDKKDAASPVHRLQADHYAVGLKMQTLHAIGAVLVDDDVDAMLSVCATVAGMKDVRPPIHTVTPCAWQSTLPSLCKMLYSTPAQPCHPLPCSTAEAPLFDVSGCRKALRRYCRCVPSWPSMKM